MVFLVSQGEEADFSIVEEVRGEKLRVYTLEGVMGLWWSKQNTYYRGDLTFQMQYDEGFYGRFTVVAFDRFSQLPVPLIKEAQVEKVFENGLDFRLGLGTIYWGNGLVFGDYLGGNPFLDVSWGKSVWLNLLLYKVPHSFGGGLKAGVDLSDLSFVFYGVYDSLLSGGSEMYAGLVLDYQSPFWGLSLEAVGSKPKGEETENRGAFLLKTYVNPGGWFVGVMGYSAGDGFRRVAAQGLDLDPDRSPFFGVSVYKTYSQMGIPWSDIARTSAEVLRFGFERRLGEDWKLTPMFDIGLVQSVPLSLKHSDYFADFHLRFDWTDTFFMGTSAGVLYEEDTPLWDVSLYFVKNFSF